MNIFHKVALEGLKKSRTRTLITIIGVALSAALITGVATFAVSLQSYMVNGAKMKYGDWYVSFVDTDSVFLEEQEKNHNVEKAEAFENIGFAMLEGGKNPDKPYLFFAGFYPGTYNSLPIDLLSGRLPENSQEVLVPAHVASNGGVKISIGDTITPEVGQRQNGEKLLSQYEPYQSGKETLTSLEKKTYTVVGIYQRPAFEERSAPGYTLITAADSKDTAKSLNTFISLKNPIYLHAYVKNIAGNRTYILNDNVLRFMGLSDDKIFNMLLYWAGGILVSLVMLGSVFLIYNSFNISLSERTHQFGILMSVGATQKQLRNSVLFEGICIGAVGIPMGFLLGIPSIKLVITLVAKNFANIMYDVPLTLKVSVPVLFAAVGVSMMTILMSAYIPAKKAAAIPVMECIRQTNEVKVEAKKLKISKFTQRIYGLEGILALKNFKRNKRRYRSIILSLTLSVVLFVSATTFRTYMNQTAERAEAFTTYDIGFGTQNMDDAEMMALYDQLKTVDGVLESQCQAVMNNSCPVKGKDMSDALREALGSPLPDETVDLAVSLHFVDDDTYRNMIKSLELPEAEYTGQNAKLIAVAKIEDHKQRVQEVNAFTDMFTKEYLDVTLVPRMDNGKKERTGKEVNIKFVEIVPPDIPTTMSMEYEDLPYIFDVIAPWSLKETLAPSDEALKVKGLTFQSENSGQSADRMQGIIDGMSVTAEYMLLDTNEIMVENKNMVFVVDLFTAIFIIMISLIAVANVFNTISTNIKLRRRELAMLRSVGMSDHDFNKMMRFECVLYGMRTLLLGIPVSVLFSWLIYKGMDMGGGDIDFIFPLSSMGISILGVFLVIFITMLYTTGKIRKENIIDALRDET